MCAGQAGTGRHSGKAGAYSSFVVQVRSACVTKLHILDVLELLHTTV